MLARARQVGLKLIPFVTSPSKDVSMVGLRPGEEDITSRR